MTHLSREKREPLQTYRVMSDDLGTYYGRIQKDATGKWWEVSNPMYPLGPFNTRAKAAAFACAGEDILSGG